MDPSSQSDIYYPLKGDFLKQLRLSFLLSVRAATETEIENDLQNQNDVAKVMPQK